MINEIVGDYKIIEKLGEGGFGVVYRAIHHLMEQEVAIKTLDAVLTHEPRFKERFFDEAKYQAKLKHPNIVTIHNFFEYEGRYYIVMEYVEGMVLPDGTRVKTLYDLIMLGPILETKIIPVFSQILDAIAYAHKYGILHRDIKPLNILFTESGAVKVADFGIAKMVGAESSISFSGTRVGTPPYMSPEQVLNKTLSKRSDIYSLGITLYEMVTGEIPFKATSTSSIEEQHLYTPPTPVRQIKPDVSQALEQIILKALEKKPENRFQNCDEFLTAIKELEIKTYVTVREKVKLVEPKVTTARVPLLLGKTKDEAIKELHNLGIQYKIQYVEGKQGYVVGQDQEDGIEVERGAVVGIIVGKGLRQPPLVAKKKKISVFAWLVPLVVIAGFIIYFLIPKGKETRVGVSTPFVPGGTRDTSSGQASVPSPTPGVGTSVPSKLTYLGKNSSGFEEYRHEKTGISLIKIPVGNFTMGSDKGRANEKPAHIVYLDEYYVGKYEVTNNQFADFISEMNYKTEAERIGKGWIYKGFWEVGDIWEEEDGYSWQTFFSRNRKMHPAVLISWNDAKAFCDWAGLRLPTEAEWEKAARGTDERIFPWGNEWRDNCIRYDTDTNWLKLKPGYVNMGDGLSTVKIGSMPGDISFYGCLDMGGNVKEWCVDWYDETYYGRSANNNPEGPASGEYRVLRGGSWNFNSYLRSGGYSTFFDVHYRCAYRGWHDPTDRYANIGFRVVYKP